MKLPSLNREQLNDLKELLTERMVDNMSTKELAEYVADDLFNYFDKLGEHEFLDEAKNYWDDMYDRRCSRTNRGHIIMKFYVSTLNLTLHR